MNIFELYAQFELVCDSALLLPTVQSLVMVGFAVGVTLWGTVADRFGRRRTALLCFVCSFLLAIAIVFAPNYTSFTALRALHTFFWKGVGLVVFTLAMEVSVRAALNYACSNQGAPAGDVP